MLLLLFYLSISSVFLYNILIFLLKIFKFSRYFKIEIAQAVVQSVILILLLLIFLILLELLTRYLKRPIFRYMEDIFNFVSAKPKFINIGKTIFCVLVVLNLVLLFVLVLVISLLIGREAILTENVVDFGFFKVYKIYFEEWELISFCENELIRQNKQHLGINLPDVVCESNNSLQKCLQILEGRFLEEKSPTFFQNIDFFNWYSIVRLVFAQGFSEYVFYDKDDEKQDKALKIAYQMVRLRVYIWLDWDWRISRAQYRENRKRSREPGWGRES